MPGPIPRTKIDNIIKLYQAGMGVHDIGKRVGVDFKTADKYIRESGIPKRSKAETAALISRATIGRKPTRFGKPIPDVVCNLYRNGANLRDLESDFGIDRKRLSSYLKRRGVSVTIGRTTPGRLEAAKRASAAAKLAPRNDEGRARTLGKTGDLIGQGEKEMIDALRARGVDPVHQLAVGSYNLDLAVEELRIAIEVQRSSWHGASSAKRERLEYLFNRGWKVVFVQVSRHGASSDWGAIGDKLVSYFEAARRNPSAAGQYGVLRRDGKPSARASLHFNNWARIPSL